jgi:hypothetical protein
MSFDEHYQSLTYFGKRIWWALPTLQDLKLYGYATQAIKYYL